MSFLKKISDVFDSNILAFFQKTSNKDDSSKGTITFRGAKAEDGETIWEDIAFQPEIKLKGRWVLDEEDGIEQEKCEDSISSKVVSVETTSKEDVKQPEVIEPVVEESREEDIEVSKEDVKSTPAVAPVEKSKEEDDVSKDTSSQKEEKEEVKTTPVAALVEKNKEEDEVSKDISSEKEIKKGIKASEVLDYLKISKKEVPSEKKDFFGKPLGEKVIKVFFAEDVKVIQIMLKALFKRATDVDLIDWAPNGVIAVAKIKEMTVFPDVILMDIAMPRMNGIEAVKEILKINPSQKIIMLTAFGAKENVLEAFAAGAIGFLRKDGGTKIILEAVREAYKGGAVPMQDEIAAYMLDGVDTSFMEQ